MLEAKKRLLATVTTMEKVDNALILQTENGKLKIQVYDSSIIRVMYTLEKDFSTVRGIGLDQKLTPKACIWSYKEEENSIFIMTDALKLEVNKQTSAIRFEDNEGKVLMQEPVGGGKYLIPYDSFKTVFDEESKVERVVTPDGIKEIVQEAKKEYDRVLYHSRLEFVWDEKEAIYGLGQQEDGTLNLRGERKYIHQANKKTALPFFLSTNGYAMLFDTYAPIIFNDNEYGSYIYHEACLELDYYFINGTTFDELIKGYRFLTGKAAMLPKWAFGFMQSMERYESQQEILDTVKKFRETKNPLDCIVLDWQSWEEGMWGQKSFDATRFPDPIKMTNELHELGVHFMISVWPNMNRKCRNYKEMKEKNGLLPMSEIYDAFSPEARSLYWEQANEGLFSNGIDAWWCDSNEPFTPEWNKTVNPEPDQNYMEFYTTARTYMPELYTNAYPLVHAQTIYEGQRAVTMEKRVTNLTRSGYLGQQKYGVILWSGDIAATWQTLEKQIPAGLNLCASGMPYWTFDIGAFFVKKGEPWFWNGDYEKGCLDLGYRELYTRWYQMGAFLPVFRSHGTDTRREIWNFGDPGSMFYDSIAKFTKLRYQLLPYIYSLAGKVYLEDYTMMRLLAFDFGTDKKVYGITDQYMFGESILVCPVTKPMYYEAQSKKIEHADKLRRVYLPEGTHWYDFWTEELYEGGQFIVADAPIEKMPLFIKAGAIIPTLEAALCTSACDESRMTINVYPGKSGSFLLYMDEGDGYHYEQKKYAVLLFEWEEAARSFRLGGRSGFYKGMPPTIHFTINVLGKGPQVVDYSGEEVTVLFP